MKRYTIECVPLLSPPETFPKLIVSERRTSVGAMKEYRRLSEANPMYHFWVGKRW